ncbi:hypothetical protein GDO78_008966 [Eleutherodactylus coqui]|uniref:Ig-like domain-containing protein n=1 Tax=Eleutherodactylus coqui TaxID=57060 RepID=A0A8J6FGG0_ELECQ|nr:hypothetical protein GDO78_008966 [Eleutherodactylus coqui]
MARSLVRLAVLSLSCALLNALELLSLGKKYEGIQGDKIVLDCKFTLAPEDTGTLDIEWFLVAPDNQQADKPVLKPANTRCYTEGRQEIGQDLSLKCNAKEGSSPLTYTWQKISGLEKLPPNAVADATGGTLNIKNASHEFSGTYRCTSKNRIGTDECLVILNVVPPANTAGIIAGAIIGTLLFLIVLGILIFFCCRKQKEKKYEKEIQHEIREDVAPPKSRTSTARSYIGSNIGSNHSSLGSLSPSNMDGYTKARYNHVPSEETERPSSQTPNYVPPKVAGPNLSRMGAIPVMIPAQSKDGSIV